MSDALIHSTVPTTPEELARCLADPMWRLCSGQLYKIMVKSDSGEGTVVPFRPNRAQRRLMGRLWHRNIILKARQLGFTTLVAIMWLDHALFNADQRCGIIAQDREAAEVIFRDKVKLAYNSLPDEIRAARPLIRDSASELLFSNNSSIRVATSMRSGTIHRLHVSEFGKICAKFPDKATEVVTGSLPAVPLDGIAIIESTAEGQEGEFYKMTQRAQAHAEQSRELTPRDWRFHFFPWWQDPGYGRDVAEILGPAGDLAQRAFQGAGQALSGKPIEGLTTAAPTAVRNVSKAFDMYQTGMYRDQKGRKVIDADGYDALVKAIGFQPSAVAQVQEANAAQQDLIGQNKLMKTELADSMAAAVFERDAEKQQEVRGRMQAWNKANPHSPVAIDMAGVRRRVIAMRQSKAKRIEKSAPKAIRGDVRAALQEGVV